MKRLMLIAKILLVFNLVLVLGTALEINAFAQTPPQVQINYPTSGSTVAGTITIKATVNMPGTSIGGVAFYNYGNLIGTVTTPTSPNVYNIAWTPPAGNFSLTAKVLGATGAQSTSGINYNVIDMVGSSSLTPIPALNPSADWVPGDNQMCVSTYPYNASTGAIPDGTCELTGSATAPLASNPTMDEVGAGWTVNTCTSVPGGYQCQSPSCGPVDMVNGKCVQQPIVGTGDTLDASMHTLSDFLVFSKSIFNKSVGELSSTMSVWYPQMSQWIAPQCSYTCVTPRVGRGQAANNYCQSANKCDYGTTNFNDSQCIPNNNYCNTGSNGRLLNIYEPNGYPNVTPGLNGYGPTDIFSVEPRSVAPTNYNGTTVDVFDNWNQSIINWMNNNYTSASTGTSTTAGAWCLPPETALKNGTSPTMEDSYINSNTNIPATCSNGSTCSYKESCSDGSACTVSTDCTNGSTCSYRNSCSDGSACSLWGDLPHVIACLNYNAGPSPAQLAAVANYQQCLNALTALTDATCALPTACSNLPASGTTPTFTPTGTTTTCSQWKQVNRVWTSVTVPSCNNNFLCSCSSSPVASTSCDPTVPGSYANWVSGNIGFGAAHNYQQCLNWLNTTNLTKCPTVTTLTGTPCDPLILGRSLNVAAMPAWPSSTDPTYSTRCQTDTSPSGVPTFATWVNDSLTLFTNEAPKFLARSQYLTDIYTKGKYVSNVLTSGKAALHKFLAPCGASDPGCQKGGPAAQLMSAQSQGNPAASLPNALIYGWQDKLKPGTPGGCSDLNGNRVGCVHLIKVTAYAPNRQGNAPFVQSSLPWPNMFTHWMPIVSGMWPFVIINGFVPYLDWVLDYRDGVTYVSVKRWDEDHGSSVSFPNKHALWQNIFHNPSYSGVYSGTGFGPGCMMGNGGQGLMNNTRQSLLSQYNNTSAWRADSTTKTILNSAFMLNDNGNGQVDTTNGIGGNGSSCASGNTSGYCQCMNWANAMLAKGTESHACARYVAWPNATTDTSPDADGPQGTDGNGVYWEFFDPRQFLNPPQNQKGSEADYSLRFVDCNSVQGWNAQDDLTSPTPASSGGS